tara:strand:- start:4184 stop:6034 length:1851 start_codon:yes stop_codon:yes gene_type:complete
MNIKRLLIKNRIIIVFILQLSAIFTAQIISLFISNKHNLSSLNETTLVLTVSGILIFRGLLLYVYKLHHGLWRYTNSKDIIRIVKSTTIGSSLYAIVIFAFSHPIESGIVIILDWVFILFFLTGIRFVSRLMRETKFKPKEYAKNNNKQRRLLIVGAGDAGINLCKNINQNHKLNYEPIVFVDDDENKIGSIIQDVPVAGKIKELPSIIARFNIEKAVLAIPSANPKQKSIIIEILNSCGLEFEILPSTPDVLAGNVSTNKIREVNALDILGRLPTTLNSNILNKFINDACILITGAGGSVGSDLARQTTKYRPKTLIILDQIENPLLFLESEIKSEHPEINLITIIGDVTDKHAIEKILSSYRPNIILHAAAHKHVPFMENNPEKAIKNNIGGTLALALAAIDNNVQTFVFVSTDKAANPTSIMGATKRIGELLINQFNSNYSKTNFVSVRFGNVFGSNASVVPIFKNQIESGGPITVTHPEVTRYFMSIQEATGLILQAGAISDRGEIFVLDMGDPIKIIDLANTLISLYGLQDQIEIKFTGLRPGEKLHEILNSESELLVKTEYPRISTIQTVGIPSDVIAEVDKLLYNLHEMSREDITTALKNIIPNYTPLS